MDVYLEPFSLRHIAKQFRQFNSAVHGDYARLNPYFWWVRSGNLARFNFILSGIIVEKLSYIMRDLPYNKKFIIRYDGDFSGVIGLDGMAQNAARAELWYFVTSEYEGKQVASNALSQLESFAKNKSIGQIYARTLRSNRKSQYLLDKHGYHHYYPSEDSHKNRDTLMWCKYLNNKNIEK